MAKKIAAAPAAAPAAPAAAAAAAAAAAPAAAAAAAPAAAAAAAAPAAPAAVAVLVTMAEIRKQHPELFKLTIIAAIEAATDKDYARLLVSQAIVGAVLHYAHCGNSAAIKTTIETLKIKGKGQVLRKCALTVIESMFAACKPRSAASMTLAEIDVWATVNVGMVLGELTPVQKAKLVADKPLTTAKPVANPASTSNDESIEADSLPDSAYIDTFDATMSAIRGQKFDNEELRAIIRAAEAMLVPAPF